MTETLTAIEARVRDGARLDESDLRHLASLDVLTLGMLADEARRRLHGGAATFVCVDEVDVTQGWKDIVVADRASEVRLCGLAQTLDQVVEAVARARAAAGPRLLSGFSLADLLDRSRSGWGEAPAVLARLREAGLDAVADAPLDRLDLTRDWPAVVRAAGLSLPRLTVELSLEILAPHKGVPSSDRVATLLAIRRLQDDGAVFHAIAPLPRTVPVATPTTGYDDVRAVALARLALDGVVSVQVDWQQYGPKLAQVALAFGADDLDNVSAQDDPERGWRRAPVEEVRRNISAAGLDPVERDGRFVPVRPFDRLRVAPSEVEGRLAQGRPAPSTRSGSSPTKSRDERGS